jgi:predicted permease
MPYFPCVFQSFQLPLFIPPSPLYYLAVVSLGVAICANTAIYSIVDAAILHPLPVSKPDQLFTLSYPDIYDPGSTAGPDRDSFSYPEYAQYATVTRPVARLAFFSSPFRVEARVSHSETRMERVNRVFVPAQAFGILNVHPAIGRLFSAEEDRIPLAHPVAALSYDYWHRRFNSDPAVIGRNILVDGKICEIIGVAQKGFFGVEPGQFVDVWVPAGLYDLKAFTDPGWHWFRILGRLAPGTSLKEIEARLQPSFHRFRLESIKQVPTMPKAIQNQFLQSTIRAHPAATGMSDFRKTFSSSLWIVFGVAAGILLIACANVASLLLARATARSTEMAMRLSLGAARLRLIRQMLTESLIFSLLAGALGWLLACMTAPLLVRLLSTGSNPVQFVLAVDTRVLFFCIGISTVSAVLFGLVPAWQASGAHPIRSLRASAEVTAKLWLSKVFVGLQVACAFCLVTVGAAFLFSLGNLLHVNPGFDARNMAVLNLTTEASTSDDPVSSNADHRNLEASERNRMLQLQSALASQPGIEAAAIAWWPIFEGGGWSQQVFIPGKEPSEQEEILYPVSRGYFAALHTPVIAGRDFIPADSKVRNPSPVIVNEAFARKYFGTSNVLGREFSIHRENVLMREMIVGVASDAHYYNLRGPADPTVYLPIEGSTSFTLYVRSPLPLGQIVRLVDRQANALGSGMRISEITTLEMIVGNTLMREKLLADLGGAFAFFGLLLAAVGLFGLLNYSVARRTKEIGVRAALGAQRSEIVSLVLKGIAGLMGAGILIGLGGALAIMMVFQSLLFGIQRVDPFVTATAIVIFLLAGLIAASFPAHRAASLDPVRALREE